MPGHHQRDAEPRTLLCGNPDKVLTAVVDVAALCVEQTADVGQQRRLAHPVAPDESMATTLGDHKACIEEDLNRPVREVQTLHLEQWSIGRPPGSHGLRHRQLGGVVDRRVLDGVCPGRRHRGEVVLAHLRAHPALVSAVGRQPTHQQDESGQCGHRRQDEKRCLQARGVGDESEDDRKIYEAVEEIFNGIPPSERLNVFGRHEDEI
ncbi:MAG TPA: hypothetical protein PLV68_04145, partial [Ilumatobacteraceae bacterium]|nr:hypothetical protein [Ilumatobacteraceae bacterium]